MKDNTHLAPKHFLAWWSPVSLLCLTVYLYLQLHHIHQPRQQLFFHHEQHWPWWSMQSHIVHGSWKVHIHGWTRYVTRVVEYHKKSFQHLTTFFMSTWWGDPKNMKELNSHDGFLSYLQNSTANSALLAAHFCPVLVCPQKATVRIRFFPYFWNFLIK